MDKPVLNYARMDESVRKLQKREEDVGYDLYHHGKVRTIILYPGEISRLGTGIKVACPKGYSIELLERSSVGMMAVAIRGRIIDTGYRGEIKVAINNVGNKILIMTYDVDNIVEIIKQRIIKYRDMSDDVIEEMINNHEFEIHDLSNAIAQMEFRRKVEHEVVESTEEHLNSIESERGSDGYGSTNDHKTQERSKVVWDMG